MHLRNGFWDPRWMHVPCQISSPCLVSMALHLQKQRADCTCSVFLSLYFHRVPPCGSIMFYSRFLLPPLPCLLSAAFSLFLLIQWITSVSHTWFQPKHCLAYLLCFNFWVYSLEWSKYESSVNVWFYTSVSLLFALQVWDCYQSCFIFISRLIDLYRINYSPLPKHYFINVKQIDAF